MAEVVWTRRALRDLNEIGEFIARDSPRTAELYVERLFAKPNILQTMPKAGRIVPEKNDRALRELIMGNYRIVYRLKSRLIEILTVHHSARPLEHSPDFEKF
jgi:toxin ParE1/3/4